MLLLASAVASEFQKDFPGLILKLPGILFYYFWSTSDLRGTLFWWFVVFWEPYFCLHRFLNQFLCFACLRFC